MIDARFSFGIFASSFPAYLPVYPDLHLYTRSRSPRHPLPHGRFLPLNPPSVAFVAVQLVNDRPLRLN